MYYTFFEGSFGYSILVLVGTLAVWVGLVKW